MNLLLENDTVSLMDFARSIREQEPELAQHNRPRVLTQNGKAVVVVLSVEAYQELRHDAEEHRLDMRLHAALEDYASGNQGIPAEEAFQNLRQRALKRQNAIK